MNIIYPDRIDSPEDSVLLRQASNLLERAAGTTASGMAAIGTTSNVTAAWSLQKRNGRPVYLLKVSDADSEVSAEFLPSDLRNPAQARFLPYHMARLWGDLLEKRSHKQLHELMNPSGRTEMPGQ